MFFCACVYARRVRAGGQEMVQQLDSAAGGAASLLAPVRRPNVFRSAPPGGGRGGGGGVAGGEVPAGVPGVDFCPVEDPSRGGREETDLADVLDTFEGVTKATAANPGSARAWGGGGGGRSET